MVKQALQTPEQAATAVQAMDRSSFLKVDTWIFDLDLPKDSLDCRAVWLSAEERQRASRFRFDIHRDRYIAGRAVLRELLSSILDCEPGELTFVYGPAGKPFLAAPWALSNLQFNLSHSSNFGAVAVAFGSAVGIDIEETHLPDDASELVNRFFCKNEARAFASLPKEKRPTAFFNLWTRKEALLKATGEGIAHCLNQVEVSFMDGEDARLKKTTPGLGDLADWTLKEIPAPAGFAASVAIKNPRVRVHCHQTLSSHLYGPSLTDL